MTSSDIEANVQLINYVLTKVGHYLSIREMSALVFLADRYHLRKYGRSITQSSYYAHEYGPCPEMTIEIYKRMMPKEQIMKGKMK